MMTSRSRFSAVPGLLALLMLACAWPEPLESQTPPKLGVRDPGAGRLTAYLVEGRPCLPVKRFASDAGLEASVSPSRRSISIRSGNAISALLNGSQAIVNGKPFPLSIRPLERDGDFYLPLEFYEAALAVRFSYDAKKMVLQVRLQERSMSIPVLKLP